MEIKSSNIAQEFNESRFTKMDIFKSNNSTVFMINFLPNQHMPAHYHIGFELYFRVIQGNGTFTIDGNDFEVKKDDIIHCDGDEKLAFTNTSENPVSIYVVMSRVGFDS